MKRATAILIFGALLASASTAGAASSHAFRGGGWGHGVGASQYGAYGLAQKGWSVGRIIRQYYAGTRLKTLAPPRSRVRVGLLQNRGAFTLTAKGGAFDLQLTDSGHVDTVPQGEARTIRISGSSFTIERNGSVVASGVGGPSDHLRAIRRSGAKIRISQWADRRMGRGFLELRIASSNRAHLIGVVSFEKYLYGIAEVPASWPAKVQRFQAILARTYAYEKIGRVGNNRSGCNCGLLATTADQHYIGWEKEVSYKGARWVDAVSDTARMVVTYGGNPIQAYYSSSSGGMVDSSKVVWGGNLPYLRKRCDPGDYTSANPNRIWSLKLSDTTAASRLRGRFGWNIARVTSIGVLERGPGGHISRARVRGRSSGGAAVSFTTSGEGLRSGLRLKSSRVWINRNRFVTGSIRRKYDRLNCRPGLPTSARRGVRRGYWQRFQKGRMYSKSRLGTHWLYGLTLRRYLRLDGPYGRLRYPKTGVQRISRGRDRVIFQRGVIVCKRSTGRCRVRYR